MSCLLIAGLGNPGVKYQQTRHNVGFMVLDFLLKKLTDNPSLGNIQSGFCFDKKFNADIASFSTPKHKVYLLKPQTFMNLSGEAIAPFVRYFDIEEMLVIHDELDISFGEVRFKFGGSSGGHNGLKSIDAHCGSEYLRLRFGIGREAGRNVADYVLSDFPTSLSNDLERLITHSTEAALCFVREYGTQNSPSALLALLQNQFSLKKQKLDSQIQNLAPKSPLQAKDKPNGGSV